MAAKGAVSSRTTYKTGGHLGAKDVGTRTGRLRRRRCSTPQKRGGERRRSQDVPPPAGRSSRIPIRNPGQATGPDVGHGGPCDGHVQHTKAITKLGGGG